MEVTIRVADAVQPDHRHRPGRRIWVAEGVAIALSFASRGRRISTCCRTPMPTARLTARIPSCKTGLIAPLGVSVIDNKIVVTAARPRVTPRSQPALRPAVDKRRTADRFRASTTTTPSLGHRRPGRQVGLQRRQHRRHVHRQVRQDVPDLRLVSPQGGWPVPVPSRPGPLRRQAQRRRSRLCGRLHGADESRRHQRGNHRPQLPQQLRAVDDVARRHLPERQRRPAGVPGELRDGVRQFRFLVE